MKIEIYQQILGTRKKIKNFEIFSKGEYDIKFYIIDIKAEVFAGLVSSWIYSKSGKFIWSSDGWSVKETRKIFKFKKIREFSFREYNKYKSLRDCLLMERYQNEN